LITESPEISRATEGRLYVLQTWENAFEDPDAIASHIKQTEDNLNSGKNAIAKAKAQHRSKLMIPSLSDL
jgi:hypothetical protein